MSILVAEDERKVARALEESPSAEGYSVAIAHTGEDEFFLANLEPFRNGIEVLSALWQRGLRTPGYFLTARDAVEDRMRGPATGPDGITVLPFVHEVGSPLLVDRVVDDRPHTVVIKVEDSGRGISPEHRERVFDRFYRVDEARSLDGGGAGLGLAIAKWGAETHGGRLELEWPPGGGCVSRFSLPADLTAPVLKIPEPRSVPA